MDIYKRLIAYIKPYLNRLAMAVVCMLGYSVVTALVSAIPYLVLNGMYNQNEVIVNIPHVPFLQGIHFPVFWVPVFMVVISFLRAIFEYISSYQMSTIGISAVRQIRNDLYKHLTRLSHDFYSKGRTGDFLSRIMNDVGSIQGAVTDVIVDIVKQPLTILFNIPMVFIWGGPHAVLALLIFPLVAIPITILGKNLRRTTKKMQERSADITAFIGETLAGMHIIKSFNREEYEINKFKGINKSVFDFFSKTIRITLIQRPLIEIMAALGASIAVWFEFKHLPPDRFMAFVISLFLFYEPLKKISKVNSTIQQSIAAGTRIFEILDAVPTIRDKSNAVVLREPVGEIFYDRVNFGYVPDQRVLQDITLKVKRGEVVALVGASGSGKTTLVSLLLRFYDATSGSIKINGIDIRDLTLESLRNKMAIVTQETVLFNATVRENISFGNLSATLEEVRQAARTAYADHFIEEIEGGYDAPLGERGLKLSGGQRQRLAIARALLKNPEILIFDEATSHLDTESEREVQSALENAMKNRTVFVIAHRLSTIQRADRILVMSEGRIVQEGTNEQLLREGGTYKKLYDLQFNI
jgi:ATP-binding cassette, subfamily B, bacterial MsbA